MNICSSCLEPCQAEVIDYGIGMTQYGSSWQNDINPAVVSTCCEAPVTEKDDNMQYEVTFNHPVSGLKTFLFDKLEYAETVINLLKARWGKQANPRLSPYGPLTPSPEFVRIQKLRAEHYGVEVDDDDFYQR